MHKPATIAKYILRSYRTARRDHCTPRLARARAYFINSLAKRGLTKLAINNRHNKYNARYWNK
jgi:hypothetical protein